MSHTPGPWRVRGGAASVYAYDIVGPKGEDIGYANPTDGADEATVYPVAENARLMAAAPDLLAALKALTDSYTRLVNSGDCGFWDPETETPIQDARAAIAKAEGR
jgi:hypothetical protein